MITGRLRTSLHSQFTTSEVGSRAYLKLHPDTAKNLGLTEGDLVSIESRRGRIDDLQLQLTEDIDPRVVWASDGWWVKDGNMNLLTDDLHTAFGHTPGFNSVLVSVTKSTT
ncbi:MAG: molybdopterin dinucleotide binding domain-containing protein [Candidatus Thorarchaeota archaeon]